MSTNWPKDIAEMHEKFGVNPCVRAFDKEKLREYLHFRLRFLGEELQETAWADNPAEFVDGLIDLCVVAIGTLNAFDVDAQVAWDRVHAANMSKQVGIKASRPNPLGLPDLIKPEGWVAPAHDDNIGLLAKLYTGSETPFTYAH